MLTIIRNLLTAVTLAALSIAGASVTTASSADAGSYYAYTDSKSYGHTGPGKGYKIIANYGPCKRFKIVSSKGGWRKAVRKGYVGWFHHTDHSKHNPCGGYKKAYGKKHFKNGKYVKGHKRAKFARKVARKVRKNNRKNRRNNRR